LFLKSRRAAPNPFPCGLSFDLVTDRFLKRAVVLSSAEMACECDVLEGAIWGANAEAPFAVMSRRVTDGWNFMMNKYELSVYDTLSTL